jgi:hypothetical protein
MNGQAGTGAWPNGQRVLGFAWSQLEACSGARDLTASAGSTIMTEFSYPGRWLTGQICVVATRKSPTSGKAFTRVASFESPDLQSGDSQQEM